MDDVRKRVLEAMMGARPAIANMKAAGAPSVRPADAGADALEPVEVEAVEDPVQPPAPDYTEPSGIGELKRDEDFPPGGASDFAEGMTDGGVVEVEIGEPEFVQRRGWNRDAELESLLSKLDLASLAR